MSLSAIRDAVNTATREVEAVNDEVDSLEVELKDLRTDVQGHLRDAIDDAVDAAFRNIL